MAICSSDPTFWSGSIWITFSFSTCIWFEIQLTPDFSFNQPQIGILLWFCSSMLGNNMDWPVAQIKAYSMTLLLEPSCRLKLTQIGLHYWLKTASFQIFFPQNTPSTDSQRLAWGLHCLFSYFWILLVWKIFCIQEFRCFWHPAVATKFHIWRQPVSWLLFQLIDRSVMLLLGVQTTSGWYRTTNKAMAYVK